MAARRRRFARTRSAVSRAGARVATVARRVTRRPRAAVVAVVSRVASSAPVRRVAASRPVTYLRSQRAVTRGAGLDLKAIAIQTLMNGLGGVSSAIGSAIPKVTKTTADDFEPVTLAVIKGGVGVGVRWLFGGAPNAREFVAGWNGHTAGSAFETYVVSKLLPK